MLGAENMRRSHQEARYRVMLTKPHGLIMLRKRRWEGGRKGGGTQRGGGGEAREEEGEMEKEKARAGAGKRAEGREKRKGEQEREGNRYGRLYSVPDTVLRMSR